MTSTNAALIRVLIVDDHLTVRVGLTSLLRTYSALEVVASVSDADGMFATLEQHQVDIILLDLRMPGMTGIEVLQRLKADRLTQKVIVLTSYESDEYIYEALRAGCKGYLLKACSEEEMIEAIHAVYKGRRYLPHHVLRRFANRVPRSLLSSRQTEILDHISRGLSVDEVTREIHCTTGEAWQQICMTIELIEGLDPGVGDAVIVRSPTMADIARRAGVSVATVSRVLHNKGMHSEETRRAVMNAVEECDFQRNGVAASLAHMRGAQGDA